MMSKRKRSIGLDFLRVFALFLIVGYHLFRGVLPGGFIGVDIFFVLSGFLTTRSLLKDDASSLNIQHYQSVLSSWGSVLSKRICRLNPPLIAMVLSMSVFCLLFNPDFRVGLGEKAAAALSWTTNLYQIVIGGSYVQNSLPNIFVHTWWLAVEVQVFLVWSLVVLFLKRRFRFSANKYKLRIVIAVLALAVSVPAIILQSLLASTFDNTLLYFSPLFHSIPLLLGSASAALYPILSATIANFKHQASPKTLSRSLATVFTTIIALAAILSLSLTLEFEHFEYLQFGMLLTSLLTVVPILSLQNVSLTPKLRPFALPVIFFAERSYCIYLFHFPLYSLTKNPWITIFLTLIFTELTFRLVERPFSANTPLRLLLSQSLNPDALNAFNRKKMHLQRLAKCAMAVGIITILSIVVFSPKLSALELSLLAQERNQAVAKMDSFGDTLKSLSSAKPVLVNANPALQPKKPSENHSDVHLQGNGKMTAEQLALQDQEKRQAEMKSSAPAFILGDSVCLSSYSHLLSDIPGIWTDCQTSRHPSVGLKILQGLKSRLPTTVVIELATNTSIAEAWQYDEIVKTIGKGHHIIFVTGFGMGRDDIAKPTEYIRGLTKYQGVSIADWAKVAINNTDHLGADGVHPKDDFAMKLYASVIADAVKAASGGPLSEDIA